MAPTAVSPRFEPMASLHPSHGARVVLERDAIEAREARYRVSIYEPAEVHASVARIDAAGGVGFEAWTSEPPAWALTFARRVLEGLPKKHAADGSWPRKLTRWRDQA